MIDKESHIRPIGYGAMLCEGLVGVTALIAACSLHQGDYFAINTPPAVFATLNQQTVALATLEAEVGEQVAGRTGGAVSLAVGMAQIFSKLPGMAGLMDYWYHFAIMFEALFILTVIDAGTRVGRYLVGEFLGRVYAPFARPNWMPGSIISTIIVVFALGVLHRHRQHQHHLADVRHRQSAARRRRAGRRHDHHHQHRQAALRVGDDGAAVVPDASRRSPPGFLTVKNNFWPMAVGPRPDCTFRASLNSGLTVTMMILVLIILGAAVQEMDVGPQHLRRTAPARAGGVA